MPVFKIIFNAFYQIRSPQLQQAVDDLQNAIESDPTGAVIANFGMTPPAGGVVSLSLIKFAYFMINYFYKNCNRAWQILLGLSWTRYRASTVARHLQLAVVLKKLPQGSKRTMIPRWMSRRNKCHCLREKLYPTNDFLLFHTYIHILSMMYNC